MAINNANSATPSWLTDSDDFLGELDNEISEVARKDKERELAAGFLRVLFMPAEADAAGDRRTRIRHLYPLQVCSKILVHSSVWGVVPKFQTVCPLHFGKPCAYCKMTADEQKKNSVKSDNFYAWTVWNYDANGGKGDMQVLAYAVNRASPIKSMKAQIKEYEQEARDNGDPVLPATEYDLILTQHGKESDRTFDVTYRTPRPFNPGSPIKDFIPLTEANVATNLPLIKQKMLESVTYLKSKELLDLPAISATPASTGAGADEEFPF